MEQNVDLAQLEVVVEKRSPSEGDKETPEYDKFPDVDKKVQTDSEPILPDHYYDGGRIPVFKPTMDQFRSFKDFVNKIDHYGMKSGIVKIIPPAEWRESLPSLDTKVKEIRVKNPITQHIAGTGGVYRQTNLEKQKSYNLPQWRTVCESSDHQPPARRGERRKNQEAKTRGGRSKQARSTRRSAAAIKEDEDEPVQPLTPPANDADGKLHEQAENTPDPETSTGGRQPKTRKKYVRKTKEEQDEMMDNDPAWDGFDYHLQDVDEFTPERCEELERAYWRTLTYNSPLYGADMPGSLFDDTTTSWNVAKLENILDSLGKKLPGVNTAYLYLGMWKSTFSWHLEDVDLYSINYIHFGAPKQWYSVSQEDLPKFEKIMKSIWPNEAKKCAQFLRHKTFLVSPHILESQYKLKINKLVHHEGEFVITFPYGYHSGYNLGYNCAESVNFATEAWLEYGRNAKKCGCVDDAVWVDVDEVERKMRGEPTEDEMSDDDDDLSDDDEGDEEDGAGNDLPTPPESVEGAEVKQKPQRKRKPKKRKPEDEIGTLSSVKKVRLKFSAPVPEACILCPNEYPNGEILPTDTGKQAHRLCAMYIPETYFGTDSSTNTEIVYGFDNIPKARKDLKCYFCRSKKGACFQCSEKKCIRAYHATCAAAAGVLVEMRRVVGEDGIETENMQMDFRCRFHRPKRGKDLDGERLEDVASIGAFAKTIKKDDIIQMQYYRGDIFAGVVAENRASEQMLLVDILPEGGLVEVEWKWILAPDSNQTSLASSSAASKMMSSGYQASQTQGKGPGAPGVPRSGDIFHPSAPKFKWGDFQTCQQTSTIAQKPSSVFWHYLGEHSTENVSKYSEDPGKRVPNDQAVIVPKKVKPEIAPSKPATITAPATHWTTNNTSLHKAGNTNILYQPYQPQPQPQIPKPYDYPRQYYQPPQPPKTQYDPTKWNLQAYPQPYAATDHMMYYQHHGYDRRVHSQPERQEPPRPKAVPPPPPMTSHIIPPIQASNAGAKDSTKLPPLTDIPAISSTINIPVKVIGRAVHIQ